MMYACVSAWVDDDERMDMNDPIFSYLFDVFCGSPEEEKNVILVSYTLFAFVYSFFFYIRLSKKVRVRVS